jgi:hypothetical protein
MSIFSLTASSLTNNQDQIDIDELYEHKQVRDAATLALFTKLLKRIHIRIKTISRQRKNNTLCWFQVPTSIIGHTAYNYSNCVAFLIKELTENKFLVKFIKPNMLLISWDSYIPTYAREQIKKTLGYDVDEHGNRLNTSTSTSTSAKSDMFTNNSNNSTTNEFNVDPDYSHMNYDPSYSVETHTINYDDVPKASKKRSSGQASSRSSKSSESKTVQYTPIDAYKPSGKMLYSGDMLHGLDGI